MYSTKSESGGRPILPTAASSSTDPSAGPATSLFAISDARLAFVMLAGTLILSFSVHNYMQELITNLPNFSGGSLLGYLEVLGLTLCTLLESVARGDGHKLLAERRAPWSSYLMLAACLLVSSQCSSMALDYINYPTKVAIRSCKLIPALFLSTVINKKRVLAVEYLMAILISLGLVCFTAADAVVYPDMNPLGIGLALISVVADAFLPTFQEHVFAHGASRMEVSFYSNIVSVVILTLAAPMLAHDSIGDHFRFIMSSFGMMLLLTVYALLSYGAITVHMLMVKAYGGIATVLVGNTRKALTILMSFLLFPKPWSPLYLVGSLLVFGGLIGHAYVKESSGSGRISSAQKTTTDSSPHSTPPSPRLESKSSNHQ